MRDAKVKRRMRSGSRNPRSKLSEDQVIDLKRRRAAGERLASLSSRFGVDVSAVSRIANGVRRAS